MNGRIADSTIQMIRDEAMRGYLKHPREDGGLAADPVRAVAILAEEVGELAADILTATRPSTDIRHVSAAWMNAKAEAVQVAAVAARIVDLIDERRGI